LIPENRRSPGFWNFRQLEISAGGCLADWMTTEMNEPTNATTIASA